MEASFSSRVDTPLILPQPIDLALRIDVVVLHVGRESFECVYLLEDDEIALIAALDGEERLPSSKGIERALWPILESIQYAVIRSGAAPDSRLESKCSSWSEERRNARPHPDP